MWGELCSMKLTHDCCLFPRQISFKHWLDFKGFNLAYDSPCQFAQLLSVLLWWRLLGYQTDKKRTKCLIPSSLSSNAGLISPGSGASLVGLRDRDECLASPGASPSPLRPFISFHEGLFRFSASSFNRLKTGHLQKNKNARNTRPVKETQVYTVPKKNKNVKTRQHVGVFGWDRWVYLKLLICCLYLYFVLSLFALHETHNWLNPNYPLCSWFL